MLCINQTDALDKSTTKAQCLYMGLNGFNLIVHSFAQRLFPRMDVCVKEPYSGSAPQLQNFCTMLIKSNTL